MGPVGNKFWLPLFRLSTFFVAVVVAGNLLFQAACPSTLAAPSVGREEDYYTKKKKRIEKSFRAFQRFLLEGGLFPQGAESGAAPFDFDAEGAALLLPEPMPALFIESETPFTWDRPAADPPARAAAAPLKAHEFDALCVTPEFVSAWMAAARPDPFGDAADAVLGLPELLFNSLVSFASSCVPRSGSSVWEQGQSEPVTGRIFDLEIQPRRGSIFADYMTQWVEREQRFFARFDDSYLNTHAFEDGEGEVDQGDLVAEQRKILWDALRRTYLAQYKFKPEERIRDEAFYFTEWRGIDFAVLPPLIAGYLYYRGIDKKFSISGTWLRVSLEPLERWMGGDEDLPAGLSVEWGIKGFPLGIIATAGMYDGSVEFDFVGVGTSAGLVRKALALHRGE
jgi:hypothetical protein